MKNKSFFITIFLFLFIKINLISQNIITIDYYGVICNEIDKNMSKMTSDLYYSQLCEINNFHISDKRMGQEEKAPEYENLSNENLSFYTVITKELSSSKWNLTLTLIDKGQGKTNSMKKDYDSFYKILMEPKSELQVTIKNLLSDKTGQVSTIEDFSSAEIDNKINNLSNTKNKSTELLSGTWIGEDNINKIVIMRGGRGFVIFNNGASMNVSVEINDDIISIKQNGKSNASFFPDLPREKALKVALEANPIFWELTMVDQNTLKGKKNTLVLQGDNIITDNIPVQWTRKN